MCLIQQCCSALPAASTNNKEKLCFYRNSGQSLVDTPMQSLMEGGEVALWSDNYCPSPECSINGTYGWMYPKAQDKVFSESFGKMVFPGAAGAAGSLWNYVAALAPGGVPTDTYTSALQHHVLRLQQRSVYACDNNCTCDWGSKCIGSPDAYYNGHPTPNNMEVERAAVVTRETCFYFVNIH